MSLIQFVLKLMAKLNCPVDFEAVTYIIAK